MKSNHLSISYSYREKPELFISNLVRNSISEEIILKIIKNMDETMDKLKIVYSLPGYEENALILEESRTRVNTNFLEKFINLHPRLKEKRMLQTYVECIQVEGKGNCYEYAMHDYFLLKKFIEDIEIFRVKGNKKNRVVPQTC